MDHPLLVEAGKALRGRVVQHLKSGCNVKKSGNLIFVCGGNAVADMRPRFTDYCRLHHPDLELFQPEYAMKDYFSGPGVSAFDLGAFERLVSELSHAIVLFPEAAGSFTETGYFAQDDKFRTKTLLALDVQWQGEDSFISMGPSLRFSTKSRFRGVMQVSYATPDFEQVVRRIKRYDFETGLKEINLDQFADVSAYDLFCLVHKIIKILGIATLKDVIFILKGIFRGRIKPSRVKETMSVLVGARYIESVGGFGHYRLPKVAADLLPARNSTRGEETLLGLELTSFFPTCSRDFLDVLETPYAP